MKMIIAISVPGNGTRDGFSIEKTKFPAKYSIKLDSLAEGHLYFFSQVLHLGLIEAKGLG